jgi:flagellar motor switch protein FliN/FliY
MVPTADEQELKTTSSPNQARISMELFSDVRVSLEARLGETATTVDSIMKLKPGSVVTLETSLADHVHLYLNNILVATGEIVAVGGKYGVRIVEIAAQP